MPNDKPTLDYDDPNRKIDSDEAWARLSQPTGRKTLSFWWLFLVGVVMFFVVLLGVVIWHASAGG